ncbi:hypothetical protein PoMZ_13483 [Pyricularia oryzae]|uniref:Uncharacterized protein n=1 Tax=Pyricularia oryzae TaxID=318829 RepID=A0A4P7NV77_PYROR|nr:hypothetical protein PoMZ_13483 [Pyricularia oryzae]
MPQVVKNIRNILRIIKENLTRFGQTRPIIGTNFAQLVQIALDGNYYGPYYEFFDYVKNSRLRAVVHKINGKFATDIRIYSKKRV